MTFSAALALPILFALVTPPEALKPDEKQRFDAAKIAAEGDAAKLVSLALWCETRGLEDERKALLAKAVEADPKNVAARGLQRQVKSGDLWESPEQVADRIKADAVLTAKLAEYNARRDKLDRLLNQESQLVDSLDRRGMAFQAPNFRAVLDRQLAPEHIKLGLWCERNGLMPEALANFTAAVHLDPFNDATWRHLGYVRHNGKWMSHAQIAAATREAAEQKHAITTGSRCSTNGPPP